MAKKVKKKKSSAKSSKKKTSSKKSSPSKKPAKKTPMKRVKSLEELRQYTRFKPAVSLCAQIDTNLHTPNFESQLLGLILNQSPGGCALIITQNEELKLKSTFKIKIDEDHSFPAEVVWRVDLDSEVAKIGVRFLDQ